MKHTGKRYEVRLPGCGNYNNGKLYGWYATVAEAQVAIEEANERAKEFGHEPELMMITEVTHMTMYDDNGRFFYEEKKELALCLYGGAVEIGGGDDIIDKVEDGIKNGCERQEKSRYFKDYGELEYLNPKDYYEEPYGYVCSVVSTDDSGEGKYCDLVRHKETMEMRYTEI